MAWISDNFKNDNAICTIAVTNQDIYNGENSNFVFGLASRLKRVGCFSFHRLNPEFHNEKIENQEELESIKLLRSCKVMTHEIGHMFGHKHCIYY